MEKIVCASTIPPGFLIVQVAPLLLDTTKLQSWKAEVDAFSKLTRDITNAYEEFVKTCMVEAPGAKLSDFVLDNIFELDISHAWCHVFGRSRYPRSQGNLALQEVTGR